MGLALGGFMAVGKTTVGQVLARRLSLPFYDLDALIEDEAGMCVAEIFQRQGQAAFRSREATALRAVVMDPDMVLALGGGTLHSGDNRRILQGWLDLVVLDLSWPQVQQRLHGDSQRPLGAQAQELYLARKAGYRLAGRVVCVDGLDPEQAADRVLECLC